jgi:RimJ/RimL family protein N-acetyltransferase
MPSIGPRLPTLTADSVHLRWIEDGDAAALFEIFSDPLVTRYWSSPAWTSLSQAEELIADVRACFTRGDLLQWGIARTDDNRLIGTCTLAHVDHTHHRAELGFALARAHWGHGLATASVRRLLTYGFDALDLHRVEADVDPRNLPSIALLERIGFQREGRLRERWHVNGEICDGLFYGLLRSEWA